MTPEDQGTVEVFLFFAILVAVVLAIDAIHDWIKKNDKQRS